MKLPSFRSRRQFLGGAAVAISLPVLPSLSGGRAFAAGKRKAPAAPLRLIVYHVPNGFHHKTFTPVGTGSKFTLSPTLAALNDLKSEILIPRGIANTAAVPLNAGGAHAVGCAGLLTCTYPRQDRMFAGVSLDQIVARELGKYTRLSSLQLGMDGAPGDDELGWPGVYNRHISWASPTSPLPNMLSPRKAFDRMFRGFDPTMSRADVMRRRSRRASVLDTVATSALGVSGQLNPDDREKLDEYLTSIREFETGMDKAGDTGGACKIGKSEFTDATADFNTRHEHFHELMRLALMCDTTRVITFQNGNGLCKLSYPNLGFTDDGHGITHHGPDEEKIAKVKKMDAWRVSMFAEFLRTLKNTRDVDGNSLLHNSAVLYMSEISDGDKHDQTDKPMVIAGQLGGRIKTGHVLVTKAPPEDTGEYPMCNETTRTAKNPFPKVCTDAPQLSQLYMTLIGHLGLKVTPFGETGTTPLSLEG